MKNIKTTAVLNGVHDGISNEQITYGGSQLVVHMSLLFNAML